jgi:putative transposase
MRKRWSLFHLPLPSSWLRSVQEAGYRVAAVDRPEGAKGFVLLPKRWVVERSLAWLGAIASLARDMTMSLG